MKVLHFLKIYLPTFILQIKNRLFQRIVLFGTLTGQNRNKPHKEYLHSPTIAKY